MFDDLKPGDHVIRLLAGKIPMLMIVTKVENGVITCDAIHDNGAVVEGQWTFDAKTGGEIDADLGWFPPLTPTGSILQRIKPDA